MKPKSFLIALLFAFTHQALFGQVAEQTQQDSDHHVNFFQGTYAEAIQKAKDDNKPIFVDVYTSWCSPCKWMNEEVFTDSLVSAYFNDNLICYHYEKDKVKDGTFPTQFKINGYPDLLFVNPNNGNAMINNEGAAGKDGLIQLGKRAVARYNDK